MEEKVVTKTVYVTKDGKEFLSQQEAEEHEKEQESVKYFKVSAYPDLSEGRWGMKDAGCVAVIAERYHAMFAEHACFKLFGNKVTFVQGVFGSNAITENWSLNTTPFDYPQGSIIATVQDRFCKVKLYEEGVIDKRKSKIGYEK